MYRISSQAGLEKITSPLSRFSWTRTLCSFFSSVRAVGGDVIALYCPSRRQMVQKPFSGLAHTSLSLFTRSLASPKIQSSFSPTSVSQLWFSEVKALEPSTSALMWKRSGLLGRPWIGVLYWRLVRSSESARHGCAVFGSRITGPVTGRRE